MSPHPCRLPRRHCHQSPLRTVLTILAILLLASTTLDAATYYISPKGNDAKDGTSESTAWKTVAKVDAAKFQPGDQILFACGGEWRETLIASSDGAEGKPIIYASYGKGAKPKFLGSEILPNADFQPAEGGLYKINVKHPVDRHQSVAVGHELLPWVGLGKPVNEMMALVEQTKNGYWIDDGFSSHQPNNIVYINTGGSNPRMDGKVYELCIHDDVIQNAYKSHVIFRDLVVDESARLELGYGFRIMGGRDIRLENCEAYRVGVAHFGIVNADKVTLDHCFAAYAMPNQTYIRNSAIFINNGGGASVEINDFTCEHMENYPGQRNYEILVVVGDSTGTILAKNLTSKDHSGTGFTIGNRGHTTFQGGSFENAYGVLYSNDMVFDGITMTGISCLDFFGSNNLVENCKFIDIDKQNNPGGPNAPLNFRNNSNNTVRSSPITLKR